MAGFGTLVRHPLRRHTVAVDTMCSAFPRLPQAFVAIVWYGGSLVISGEITSGTLTSFLLYSLTIGGALAGLAVRGWVGLGVVGVHCQHPLTLCFTLPTAGSLWLHDASRYSSQRYCRCCWLMLTHLPPSPVGANDRVFQLMDRKPHVPVKGGPAPRPVEGLVEFNDVHFSYEGSLHTALAVRRSLPLLLSPPLRYPTRADQAVLRGTTFSIKPGQVAALVGPSGGGTVRQQSTARV